jgi:hypothetical protein
MEEAVRSRKGVDVFERFSKKHLENTGFLMSESPVPPVLFIPLYISFIHSDVDKCAVSVIATEINQYFWYNKLAHCKDVPAVCKWIRGVFQDPAAGRRQLGAGWNDTDWRSSMARAMTDVPNYSVHWATTSQSCKSRCKVLK